MINTFRAVLRKSGALSAIVENTMVMVFLKGLTGIARVFLFLLIARQFGPAEFGVFSLVYAFVEIFRSLSDLGVDTVLIRRLSRQQGAVEALIGNAFALKCLFATGGYLIALISFSFLYPDIGGRPFLLILATTIYTTLLINLFNTYFQAKLRLIEAALGHIISALSYILLTLIILRGGGSLLLICFIVPVTELANLIILFKIYGRYGRVRPQFQSAVARELIGESLPVGLSVMMIVIYMRMDQLLLGWFQGTTAVGEYAAAFRITEPFMLIFTSLSLSLYASLSSPSGDFFQKGSRRIVSKVLMVTFLSTLSVASLLSFYARPLIGWVVTPSDRVTLVLMILSGSIVFKSINAMLTAIINSLGKYRVVTAVAAGNLLINSILGFVLIPRYSMIGAAIAVVVTEAINTAIQSIYVFKIAGRRPVG
ncbi:MAG: flippase [Nitrospirae bacterium]|nr:flippase [Candidatus Manganitrophaceae bacterium]